MAQKFVSLDEAATQLSISKDRLNELREDGRVRAYRDGTSWKFRADDIEKLAADGIPASDASSSDISLSSLSSGKAAAVSLGDLSDLELDIDSELNLDEDEALASPAASDLNLEEPDEPTVPVEAGSEEADAVLSLDTDEIDDFSDSILLSENELGESTERPPSTIIGRAEMAADLDLDLVASDSDAAKKSDVRLADPNTSSVFAVGSQDDVLDTEPPSLSDNFGDLEELEIDLEAESSRILAPEDLTKAQQAAEAVQAKTAEISDLELAASDSNPGGVLDSPSGLSDLGLTGASALDLEDDGSDDVLGDGSDITLSSESSGINIISPSDSGLALDDVSLAMGSGSPLVGSALDLGPTSDSEIGLESLEVAEDEKGAEPFTLTPFGEEAAEEEEDSSQVIPLDEVSEDDAILGISPRGGDETLEDDFIAVSAGGVMPLVDSGADVPFSTANIVGLSLCLMLLTLCGMMAFDLLRNMWSWGEVYTLNSSLMDVLTPLLG